MTKPAPGGILTLDLSSVVGWAYGHVDGPVLYGSWHLPKTERLGPRFAAYRNALIDTLERYQPRLVVMEAPLPASGQGSTFVARQQFGLAAYTEGECEDARPRLQLREQPAQTVRKRVLGASPRGGTKKIKDTVVEWCRAQGWNPPDDNAADALVLFRYTCMVEQPSRFRLL